MEKIPRILAINLPANQSAFLWGPRTTGKTTFLKKHFPQSILYDFLLTDTFLEFTRAPFLFQERLLAKGEAALRFPVIIDEVQKIPHVLDEAHWYPLPDKPAHRRPRH